MTQKVGNFYLDYKMNDFHYPFFFEKRKTQDRKVYLFLVYIFSIFFMNAIYDFTH